MGLSRNVFATGGTGDAGQRVPSALLARGIRIVETPEVRRARL